MIFLISYRDKRRYKFDLDSSMTAVELSIFLESIFNTSEPYSCSILYSTHKNIVIAKELFIRRPDIDYILEISNNHIVAGYNFLNVF